MSKIATKEKMIDCLYINEAGEAKAFPGHDGERQLTEARLPEGRFREVKSLEFMDEMRIPYTTIVWTPIRTFPLAIRAALAAFYQEREEARELAFVLYWQLLFGDNWSYPTAHAIINRAREHSWIRDHERPEKEVSE